jgi:hypothetical protein
MHPHPRYHSITGLALTLLLACGPARAPLDYGLVGGTYFLCCTLHFDDDHEASDAGYFYEPGTTLPAGTPVQIVHEKDRRLTFQPIGTVDRYTLIFRFGRKAITAGEYFREVLLAADPRSELEHMSAENAEAVARGELRIGMTRAEAVCARGYPPRHRTSSLEADEWVYYQTRDTVWNVRFDGGVISEVTQAAAPGS